MANVGIPEGDPFDPNHIDHVTSIFKITKYDLKKLFDKETGFEERKALLDDELGGVSGLLTKLQTKAKSGIMGDDRDLNRRLAFFGHNTKPAPHMPSYWESLKEALEDKILLVLAICAALSIIFGMVYSPKTGWVEGVSIYVVVVVMVMITSLNDYAKDVRFVELQAVARDSDLPVFRGKQGQMQTVDMWKLVVGDVVILNAGDVVPADCVIIRSDHCEVVEPNTEKGEGVRHPRSTEQPFLLADEQLITGSVVAVITCVGAFSTRPPKAEKLNTSETALQQKLWSLTKTFTFIGIIASFVILVTAIIIQCIQTGVNEEVGGKIFMQKLFQNITLFIVLIMVAIPEGLPMSVAISLAHSTTRMYKKEKILVRQLDAPERMGQITQVCTGLTGTLTTGEMSVIKFYAQKKTILNSRKDTIRHCELTDDMLTLIQEGILWNTEVHMELNENSFYVPVGNDTERGYMKWLQQAELKVHDHCKNRAQHEVTRIPFNSVAKRSIVAIRHPDMEDTIRVFVKGAAESILPNCANTFNDEGEKIPLEDDEKVSLLAMMKETMSAQGLRTLGFSYKDMSEDDFAAMKEETNDFFNEGSADQLAADQTFVCFVAMKDPLRDQVKKAMRRAKRAQLNVRIVTNNSLETSVAQAIDCGLLPKDYMSMDNKTTLGYAMEAAELREACGGLKQVQNEDGMTIFTPVDQNAFEQKVDNLVVLARATPDDKLLLTAGLQAAGKKTAVIGDSNNDIKSFGASHVSFCMGSGTAVAKQECDIVLTDDDFFDCMNAVMFGRNIYTNIKRFLQFQITCNFSVLITVFIGYLYLTESPISSTQLLWINLIIDTFAALSLATMNPMTSVLDEPAITEGHTILKKVVWRQIYGITLWNVIVMCIIIFGGKAMFNLEYTNSTQTTERVDGQLTEAAIAKKTHLTIIFNTFVQLTWFNEWNCRVVGPKEFNVTKNFFNSWMFLFVVIGIAVMQWFSCNWLFWLFETQNLTAQQYFRCCAWGLTVIPAAMIIKLTPEAWVEKMPVGIDENKAMGKDSILMKGYDQANQARKTSIKKQGGETQQAEADADATADQEPGQDDQQDDDFKKV